MDWLRNLIGDVADRQRPMKPDEGPSWSERVEAELAKIPPYGVIDDLPPLTGHEAACPKCGSHATTIQYRSGAHDGCPDRRMNDFGMSWWGFSLPDPETHAQTIRARERAPEHHDRSCVNCKYAWVEAVRT